MLITLTIAGIFAGLIQFFVDFKGLKLFEPEKVNQHGFTGEEQQSTFQKVIIFIKNHWQFFGYITIGIVGAYLVPLLNELLGNRLIGLDRIKNYADCITSALPGIKCDEPSRWYYLILLGYGIVSGYSSVRIIRSLGSMFIDSLSEKQKDQQRKLEEAQKQINELKASLLNLQKPEANPAFVSGFGKQEISLVQDYYNETQNELDKRTYYSGIDFQKNEKLFSELNKLVTVSHKVQLPYNPSIHLYPVIDRYEDKLLRSVYSGKPFSLEAILEMDAKVDKARAEALVGFSAFNLTSEQYLAKMDELEALIPYNCEHVVPQSWFEKKEPMKGDLHHLFTCEMRCNSFRNNNRYFDFPDYGADLIKDECGKLEQNRFEPEMNKGVVARAVLYFLVRYPGKITHEKGYSSKDIPMLIKWSKNNPVSRYELHRNQQIFYMQGNRNPFIDFPELSEKIQFESIEDFTPNSGDDLFPKNESNGVMTSTTCAENTKPKPWKIDDSRLADSLVKMRSQVNALAPSRNKTSDGWFGDEAHQSRDSDHNPWLWDETIKKGVVTALDITHDPKGKCDCAILAKSLQDGKDSRIKYVIWNKKIMSSTGTEAWTWRDYSGSNPHDKHIHISVLCDKSVYDSIANWTIKIS